MNSTYIITTWEYLKTGPWNDPAPGLTNAVILHLITSELQENLIRSHSAGVGPPLSPSKTRMLLALRINVLAKGYSGISLKVLQQLIDAFNGLWFVMGSHIYPGELGGGGAGGMFVLWNWALWDNDGTRAVTYWMGCRVVLPTKV